MNAWLRFKSYLAVLHPIRFDLLLAAAAIAALLTGQGEDMLRQLLETGGIGPRWGFLLACLAFGLWLWWHARVIYLIDLGPGARSRPASETHVKVWMPRLLGAAVALLPAAWALAISQNRSTGFGLVLLALVIFGATTLRRLLIPTLPANWSTWRDRWCGLAPRALEQAAGASSSSPLANAAFYSPQRELQAAQRRTETPSTREILSELWRDRRCFAITWLMLLAASPIMVGVVLWRGGDLGWSAGTATMVGLMLLSASGGALALVADSSRLPLVGLVVVWMMASGWLTRPDITRPSADSRTSQTPDATFAAQSLAHIFPSGPPVQVSEALPAPDTASPVILVSASGGGIRAALWTATVLGELGALSPGFEAKVFAASGVSGGSVGLAAWRASLATPAGAASNPCTPGGTAMDAAERRERLQSALSGDLLTPALTTLLFTDLFARAMPVVPPSQRGRALEQAFERALAEPAPRAGFAAIRCTIGEPASRDARPLPFLVLNATELASGRRVLFHDLPMVGSEIKSTFTGAIDGRCLAPSTTWIEAAHHSARFPYVSPTGKIAVGADHGNEDCAHVPAGHALRIGDGGYFDNSGVTTTLELLAALRAVRSSSEIVSEAGDCAVRLRPIHITIANDPDAGAPDGPGPLWSVAAGLTDPLLGVLSSRAQRGAMGKGLLENLAVWPESDSVANIDPPGALAGDAGRTAPSEDASGVVSVEFRLHRRPQFDRGEQKGADMPLGWLLSRPAACEIQRQFCDVRNREAAEALFVALGDRDAFGRLQARCEFLRLRKTRSACLRGEAVSAGPPAGGTQKDLVEKD